MSAINTKSTRIYGGNPSGDPQVQTGQFSPQNAGITETLVVGTYRRLTTGPRGTGHGSLEFLVDSVGGAGSAATVWYTNHPNPSLASDADWFQDTVIGTIDLTSAANKMPFIKDTLCEYVMVKVVVAVSACNLRVFSRMEDVSV